MHLFISDLKRFSQGKHVKHKLSNFVSFPVVSSLDITPFATDICRGTKCVGVGVRVWVCVCVCVCGWVGVCACVWIEGNFNSCVFPS